MKSYIKIALVVLVIAALYLVWKRSETFISGRPLTEWEDFKGMYVGDLPADRTGKCSDVHSNSLGAICGASEWLVKKMG